jgi:hypothetical protein
MKEGEKMRRAISICATFCISATSSNEPLLEAFLPKREEELLVAHGAPRRRLRNLDSTQVNHSSMSGGHQHLNHLSSLGFIIYMPK